MKLIVNLSRQGGPKDFSQMDYFRECLDDNGLTNLGYSGYLYTWDNKLEGDENFQVRLDHAKCNNGFLILFPDTTIEHVITEELDHVVFVIHVREIAPCATKGV